MTRNDFLSRSFLCFLLCVCFFCVGFAAQTGRSPDETLSDGIPTSGLTLWLDASKIESARDKLHLSRISDQQGIDVWPDVSGNGRHFLQSNPQCQPKLIQVGEAWIARFDGEDDHLRCTSLPSELDAMTIFLVVAPHANPGDFRGIFASNDPGKRDYESGLTIDLGPSPTLKFDQLNIEGRGFGGAKNLHTSTQSFCTLQQLEVQLDRAKREVQLIVDSNEEGKRTFQPDAISMKELTLGARFYTNGPGVQEVRGFMNGDIAEVLIYDRILEATELQSIRKYLTEKHAKLAEQIAKSIPVESDRILLAKAENPPLVQMLRPGFEVREIPLELTNVNSIRYRDDGKLVALGYNGDIHLLSDTDGDGLEDHAQLFWKNDGSRSSAGGAMRGPIGMVLTPPEYQRGRGAFIPSKGKVSFIVDEDGDDQADKEIVIASGWKEITQNVDAVGIAMDRDGSIYFGLGTADYANAYLVDANGQSSYDIQSDRGTVQKISPDFKKRETICTGVRFPIAFAFHPSGDLFCSEQEGATWLANGNPFDELLHIRPGRHYGFPPRHPKYNPGVIDEPSTFDYGPQHQSTCGMVFNTKNQGGMSFGPRSWEGDAIVCGESRGKIWSTKLVKTTHGYIAQSQLLACLQMLTVDACLAPNGDLVVACHSGPPDWGTGPAGIGKLFRIHMTQPNEPQPVAVWAEGTNEIRLAFDRPLDPTKLRQVADQIQVEYGEFVRAGDRFENLAPPYAVVQKQAMSARRKLAVASVALSNDLRSLTLNTAPLNMNAHYAVSIPWDREADSRNPDALLQHSTLDVDTNLNGVRAEWTPDKQSKSIGTPVDDGSQVPLSCWLPHLQLDVSKELTKGSLEHESFFASIQRAGVLTLKTQLDLHHMLRPKIQPGSKLDYEWPSEKVTLVISSKSNFSAIFGEPGQPKKSMVSQIEKGEHVLRFETSGEAIDWLNVELSTKTRVGILPQFEIATHTNEDPRLRPLPLVRFFLPWASSSTSPSINETGSKIAELEGGNWGKGRRIFHSEAAGCFKCHAVQGSGGRIGPDLSNLVHRDYASVLRDIVNPSVAINPDYIMHNVIMKDGNVLSGVLRSEKGRVLLGDEKGNTTELHRDEIESMTPAKISVMPKGIDEKLTAEQKRDLMTYLLTPAPHMPMDSPLKAPPIRSPADVAKVLEGAPTSLTINKKLHIVLVAGEKDHGPGEHDYPAWQIQWGQLLAGAAECSVETAWGFPSEAQIDKSDVLIFFQKGTWDAQRESQMDKYFARGGGAVYIHWAVNGDEQKDGFAKRIGLASHGGFIKFRHGPLKLDMHHSDHPIMRNLDTLELYDESYWLLSGDPQRVTLLASSVEEGAAQPQVWTTERGNGRIFVSIPGHYSWTFDDPLFRILLLRGIAWTAHESVDRFNELVPLGARISR